jgi:hypothetical protein
MFPAFSNPKHGTKKSLKIIEEEQREREVRACYVIARFASVGGVRGAEKKKKERGER